MHEKFTTALKFHPEDASPPVQVMQNTLEAQPLDEEALESFPYMDYMMPIIINA